MTQAVILRKATQTSSRNLLIDPVSIQLLILNFPIRKLQNPKKKGLFILASILLHLFFILSNSRTMRRMNAYSRSHRNQVIDKPVEVLTSGGMDPVHGRHRQKVIDMQIEVLPATQTLLIYPMGRDQIQVVCKPATVLK